ncbi:MAG: hypothetical protein OEZ65_11625 [Gemmatimonadota bacterium]|nr:hypothetical protein [Gemmatimonadota bacterium]
MSGAGDEDEVAARITREVAARAVRRLDWLEWIILAGAVMVAVVGGWLVALVLAPVVQWGFRPLWTVTSLFLFAGPAVVAWVRIRTEEKVRREGLENPETESDG